MASALAPKMTFDQMMAMANGAETGANPGAAPAQMSAPPLQSSFFNGALMPKGQPAPAPAQTFALPAGVQGLAADAAPAAAAPATSVASDMPVHAPALEGDGVIPPETDPSHPGMRDQFYTNLIGQLGDVNSTITSEQEAQRGAGKGILDAMGQEAVGKAEEATADNARRDAEQAFLDDRAKEAESEAETQKRIAEAGEKAATAQMARLQSAVDAVAKNDIKDFWADASTGSRIMGVISQALAGAANGLAGQPGAITPLDRIINQDMQRQMANQQNAREGARMQGDLLNQIYRQTGSMMMAQAGVQKASMQWTVDRITAMDNKFANAKSSAVAKQAIATIQQKMAAIDQHTHAQLAEQSIQQGQGIQNAIARGMREDNAMANTQLKEENKIKKQWTPAGLTNSLPDSPRTTQLYKDTVPMTQIIANLRGAENALNSSGLDAYYTFVGSDAMGSGEGRKVTGAGANLTGHEEGRNNVFAPGYWKMKAAHTIGAAQADLIATKRVVARQLIQMYHNADKMNQLDFNDPTIGAELREAVQWDAKYGKRR